MLSSVDMYNKNPPAIFEGTLYIRTAHTRNADLLFVVGDISADGNALFQKKKSGVRFGKFRITVP